MDVVKMTPVHNTTNKRIAIHTNSSAQKTHTSNCKQKKSFPKNSKPLPLTLKKNITAKELHSSSSSSSSLTTKPKQALQQQTVPPVPAQPQCFSSSSSSAAARKRSHNDDITSALPVVSSPQPQQQSRKKPRKSSSSNSNKSNKNISTGRWTREEHELFLEGLKKHGREWKKVAEKITTRTSAQIRSHAQKYFTKLAKEQQQHQQSHHHGIGVHHPNHLGLVSHQGHVYGNPSMMIMTSPGASASSGSVHHIVHSDQINSNNTGTPFGMMTSSNQTNLSSSVLNKIERIMSDPSTVETEVETTLKSLRERYRQLQLRLQSQQEQKFQQQAHAQSSAGGVGSSSIASSSNTSSALTVGPLYNEEHDHAHAVAAATKNNPSLSMCSSSVPDNIGIGDTVSGSTGSIQGKHPGYYPTNLQLHNSSTSSSSSAPTIPTHQLILSSSSSQHKKTTPHNNMAHSSSLFKSPLSSSSSSSSRVVGPATAALEKTQLEEQVEKQKRKDLIKKMVQDARDRGESWAIPSSHEGNQEMRDLALQKVLSYYNSTVAAESAAKVNARSSSSNDSSTSGSGTTATHQEHQVVGSGGHPSTVTREFGSEELIALQVLGESLSSPKEKESFSSTSGISTSISSSYSTSITSKPPATASTTSKTTALKSFSTTNNSSSAPLLTNTKHVDEDSIKLPSHKISVASSCDSITQIPQQPPQPQANAKDERK
eukprot:CAMPEP_0178945358 /NCGR_PEP_ID=MMETSP0789-20121207/3690_1 /TAXON_ID=3005 /ORGANISM="Rhizosolenia setigera, Strain CCMP 1694" /LENGTH=711 /DNA_ID=CAMNT_0020625239 /DNA_START=304 /DNA_END=2439 /DNA_ORIENTATION=+